MNLKRIAGITEVSLRYCLAGILGLWGAVLFFIFVINWEDWFFGIKLDGFPAGFYLLIKASVAVILAFLIIGYPRKIQQLAILAILYFGFLLLDSAVTIQKNTHGQQMFSDLLGIFLIVPLALLITTILMEHLKRS
jgi:hypothetical protein